MIRSIRYFLLISLLISITIASVINGIGNLILDQRVLQPYLDGQLIRISSLIEILYKSSSSNSLVRQDIIDYLNKIQPITKQKFIFQVWRQNDLLISSTNHFNQKMLVNTQDGFSDTHIAGEDWRIYHTYNKNLKINIVVGESYNLRQNLVDDIARSNAYILLITYPIFGILIWLIINLALKSVTRVTSEISNRASTYLEPVELTEIPIEIKPLVAELNQLFTRLKLAFERNKRFAADAAHELRTPLAALKTHVQVALKTDNDVDRKKALEKVIESVDRSSHVVAQLLTLSRLGQEETLTDIKPLNLHKIATEIIAFLAPHALEKNIEIALEKSPPDCLILGNDIIIGIMIRNIVDNAIRYTPPEGEVHITIMTTDTQVIFRVTDTGTGIPLELREQVFERFYRILGTKASGSGLGLAIVNQIAALHGAEINLISPPNGIGLQFDVAFRRYQA
jgi:two-component system sensor histidine kinase QseC